MSNNIGLDIGSGTIKLVVCENGAVVLTRKALTSHDPLTVCRELLGNIPEGPIIATGYGRHLVDERSCIAVSGKETGPFVVILSDNHMGRGDDALGDILIRSFIHTLLQLKPLPATIICYNAGVKLAARDSAVLDDLQQLEKAGADILVCGTCVNYFGLGDQVAVGHISNIYDIAETMAGAARLVRP